MIYRIKYFLFPLFVSLGVLAASCGKSEQSPKTPESKSGPSVNVGDIDVTEHVKIVLNQNDALKKFDIQVVTLKGDVRLIGVVDTQAQIDEAVKIARSAEGSHTIHNELIIKK